MWKECNVVMLPTEKAENCILIHKKVTHAVYHPGKLFTQAYLRESDATSMHLYIISDEEIIKANEWWMHFDFEGQFLFIAKDDMLCFHDDLDKKIIASTDSTLGLSEVGKAGYSVDEFHSLILSLSQEFISLYIQEYNKGNQIKKVWVEYEDNGEEDWIGNNYDGEPSWNEKIELKVSPDDTINIKLLKDSWTRDEVIALIKANTERLTNSWISSDLDWIDKNF